MADKYDRKALEALAKTAGFNEYQSWLWSFIALAESGGDPNAVNRNRDGTTDTGLWQINSIHRKANPTWTEAWLKNPLNNAKAAYALAKGDKTRKGQYAGTQPWYSSEESREGYKGWKELAADWQKDDPSAFAGSIAEETLRGDLDIPIVSDVIEGADSVKDAAVGALELAGKSALWIGNPRNWLRVGYVVGGLALVVGGATLIAKPAVEGATNILPVGKLAKLAKGSK